MRDEELLELFRSDPESGAAALVEQYSYLLWGVLPPPAGPGGCLGVRL